MIKLPRKAKKKSRAVKSKRVDLEVERDAVRILRTVKGEESFYFFEGFGKPIGESAKSLSEFLERIGSVKQESLLFHLQRKDFQNWIKKTLGDHKLARRIGRISPLQSADLRTQIMTVIENHIAELRGEPATLIVNEQWVTAF